MKRFIAGRSLESAIQTAAQLTPLKKTPIFNFAVETIVNNTEIDEEFEKLTQHPQVSRVSLKCSLLGFDFHKINELVRGMVEHNKLVLIDAENDANYVSYSRMTNQLMQLYNKDKVNIVKTYQMYRRDSFQQLQSELTTFKQDNIQVGVKLVRGAYYSEDIAKRVLYYRKEDTDMNYLKGMFHLQKYNAHGVNILATHNLHSIQTGLLFNQKHHMQFEFAHLLGMRETQYQHLIDHGQIVNTYIPYGPYKYMIPYLGRRVYENFDILRHIVP